jgi:cytochrome c oxidase subunit III
VVVWCIVVLHLIYVVTGVAENGILTAWVFSKGLDTKHARDIRVGATYWYWVVAVWILVYVIVFLGPRWM